MNIVTDVLAALGLVGQSRSYKELEPEHSYITNTTIIFNYGISFDPGMIAHEILDELKYSLVLPIVEEVDDANGAPDEAFRGFDGTLEFDFGVSRQDRSASSLWLSAYIGNYIGNYIVNYNGKCLSALNEEVLEQVEVGSAISSTITTLEVEWGRVAATLGGLAGFQILFGLATLYTVDNVCWLGIIFRNGHLC